MPRVLAYNHSAFLLSKLGRHDSYSHFTDGKTEDSSKKSSKSLKISLGVRSNHACRILFSPSSFKPSPGPVVTAWLSSQPDLQACPIPVPLLSHLAGLPDDPDYPPLVKVFHPLSKPSMLALAHALTNAGHASHVQAVAVEAVAGEALGDAHAAAVGAAIQDPALLCLQALVAPSLGACGQCGDSGVQVGPCP